MCNFKFNYFNSGTSHFIANLFQLFNMYAPYGIVSQIFWYFDEEDMDMYEAGEELSFLTNLTSTRCNYLSSDFIRI
ncbi:MAG TPA: SiaC family regulatory phosphoprotein [Bacteroidales bacterium]|nr:SiaC family regulatory phosphoprotein [Bacteroidales bacterium]